MVPVLTLGFRHISVQLIKTHVVLMIEAHDSWYKHSAPTSRQQEPERSQQEGGVVCHCVRQCQTLAQPVGEGVLIGSSVWRAEYVGRSLDRGGVPRVSRLGQRIHQRARRVDACEFSLSSVFYPELCLKARRCASTPWLTFVWSLTVLLLTKRGLTISGWHTLGRSPTHDLAL